jgi:hypothetical protein
MNDVPIQIRNPEIARAIRELAAETGQPITDAVGDAVKAQLSRLKAARPAEVQRRLEAIREISRQIAKLPVLGPVPTDADFYDEEDFPN